MLDGHSIIYSIIIYMEVEEKTFLSIKYSKYLGRI